MSAGRAPEDGAVLVTGAAGFIGFHLCRRLCRDGRRIVGVDNMNAYYDVRLKESRLRLLEAEPGFAFHRADIGDLTRMLEIMREHKVKRVVNLAAQAGVRHSLTHPFDYTRTNIDGFLSVLEACRAMDIEHLVYASSSSVYGANGKQPFGERDAAVHPVSLYAATKRANELMALHDDR